MKKTLISVSLVLVLFASMFPLNAFAQINNVIIEEESPLTEANTYRPSDDVLAWAENYKKVQYPKGSSYLSDYSSGYLDAPKGHSVYVYNKPNGTKIDTALHASHVTCLANEDGFFLVFYFTQENKTRVGWITETSYSTTYPGKIITVGNIPKKTSAFSLTPSVSWSDEFFYGTKQKYTLLDSPIYNCYGFTLDYQVTSRNGCSSRDCLGVRTVYVNDGSGWVSVAKFSLDELEPVHVQIYLDKPVNLLAVATSSTCKGADKMIFRQSVLNVMSAD